VGVVAPVRVVCPVAVTVAAPDAVDELSVTEATPFASVNAVPVVGSNTPKLAFVVKVMMAPTIGVPRPFLKVALTFAGLPNEIEVRAVVEVSSVKAMTNVAGLLSVTAESFDTAPLPHPLSATALRTTSPMVMFRVTVRKNRCTR